MPGLFECAQRTLLCGCAPPCAPSVPPVLGRATPRGLAAGRQRGPPAGPRAGTCHLYRVTVFLFLSPDRYTGVHNPRVHRHMVMWKQCSIHPIFRRDTTFLGG